MRVQVFLLAALAALVGAHKSYEGHKVFRVTPSAGQVEVLARFKDLPGHAAWSSRLRAEAPYDVMVSPPQQAVFLRTMQQHAVDVELLIPDVETVFAAERMRQLAAPKMPTGGISFDQYYRHKEINEYLDQLAASYPQLVTVTTLGQSMEGRDLKVIKISSGAPGKPAIFVDGGIHGREWITTVQALYVINQLVENPANLEMLNGVDWHILPVLNPDGYEYSHTDDRIWRKTRSLVSSTICPGVDANRNFGHHWNEGGSSDLPCTENYHGPKAFSEPETESVRAYLAATADIKLYVTMHSYGGYLIYPWCYTATPPENWKDLDALAHAANDAQVKAGGKSYTIGESTALFGESAGSSDDWAMGAANVTLAFHVDLPGGGSLGFDIPPADIEPTVSVFFEAFKVFGDYIGGL